MIHQDRLPRYLLPTYLGRQRQLGHSAPRSTAQIGKVHCGRCPSTLLPTNYLPTVAVETDVFLPSSSVALVHDSAPPPETLSAARTHDALSTNTEHRAGGDRITLTHTRITCISASLRGHGALHHREGSRVNEGRRAMREVFNGSSRYCHLAGPPWHLELVKIRLVPLPISSRIQSIKGEQ